MTKTIAKVPKLHTVYRVEGRAVTYEAGAHIPPHAHEGHQIVHAVRGVMRVMARDASWLVPPGHGLWVPARVTHEIHCLGRVEMRTVYLNGGLQLERREVQVVGVSPLMREILVLLAEGCRQTQVRHLQALLLDEVANMPIEPFRLPISRDPRIMRLIGRLLEHPADPTSLSQWSQDLGISVRSLIRRIRAETGMSFRQLRRQARIMAALERLALGQPITQVAFDVGFESPSAFTQAFRTVIGKTPRRLLLGDRG